MPVKQLVLIGIRLMIEIPTLKLMVAVIVENVTLVEVNNNIGERSNSYTDVIYYTCSEPLSP